MGVAGNLSRRWSALRSAHALCISPQVKDVTPFEPSHARDLPNMVQMQNLHEAPLLYLLQRRLKDGRIYTWVCHSM